MLETMADAFALARSVFQQNLQLAKSQSLASDLKTERANLQRILFGTTARAAGMDDEIINAKRDGPLDLFAKRVDRFQQNDFIGGGEVNQIVGMNEHGRELRLLECPAKKTDCFFGERLGFPTSWVAGEQLHRITTGFLRDH